MTTGRRNFVSSEERIAQLTRERDLARTIAIEAMRTMSDGQLAELRCKLDKDIVEQIKLEVVDNNQLSA